MYNLTILDSKPLGDRTWLLCKGNLDEYLTQLKEDFYNFSIQRKIVKNQYLDTLVSTVQQGDPIPVITLTYQEIKLDPKAGSVISVDMNKVEILDGLQRSFRLWAHYILFNEFENSKIKDIVPFTKQLKIDYPALFETGVLSLSKIKSLHSEKGGFDEIKRAYKSFNVYFVLWINLNPKQIIHKMLLLNAGQRSVSKTHQFELLFLYLWEDLEKKTSIKLFREKNERANQIKSGKRDVGEYMFTSIIVGLRSFLENKPLRVTIDDLDFDEYKNEVISEDLDEDIFTSEFVGVFLDKLKEIDEIVVKKEGDEGKKWFVKDTSISGLLAALGKYGGVKANMPASEIEKITHKVFDDLKNKFEKYGLDLTGFTEQYNVLSSRSVNIGNFIRKVIMDYTLNLLTDNTPTWKDSFSKNTKNS